MSASHLQPGEDKQEPIYQNLLNLNITTTSNNTEAELEDSVHIDETVDGLTLGQGGINISQISAENEEIVAEYVNKNQQVQENIKNNLTVRKGLTTSRENISFARYAYNIILRGVENTLFYILVNTISPDRQ